MAIPAQPSTSRPYSYDLVEKIPPIFDPKTSVRTAEASELLDANGNLADQLQQYFTEPPIALDTRSARPCNPDVLFPTAAPVVQPFLSLLSWLVCRFVIFAHIARNQLGLTPNRPDALVFERFNLPSIPVSTESDCDGETITLKTFKKQAQLECPADYTYFLDKPSTEWRGITNADSRNVLAACQQNPRLAKFAKNLYESFAEDKPENADKIAIPCKPEFHVEGRSSSHGISGHAEPQAETQECLKKIDGGSTPYYLGSPTCQEPLGFDTRGEKTPNPYDAQRGCGGSTMSGAALVAAGAAPVTTATDAGGSARGPAHHCGVIGFKGGRDENGNSFISRQGSAYEDSGVCDPGLIANNVSNMVDVLQHMTDVAPTRESLKYKTSPIAVDTGSLDRVVDPEVGDKLREAITLWKQENDAHGFHNVDLMSLNTDQGANNALSGMLAHGGYFACEEVPVYDNALSPEQRQNALASLKANIATARVIDPDQKKRCEIVKLQIEQRLESLYDKGIKFLVLPTGNKVAQPVNWWHRHFDSSNPKHTFQFSQLPSYANMACLPAMTLPVGYTDGTDHMPTSLTIMATSKKVDPWELIAVSREFELVCRKHESLQLTQPEFYIHRQLTEARDHRRSSK